MTTASIQRTLRSEVITGLVSRVASSTNFLLNMFGMQANGPAVRAAAGGRHGAYDVFNNTRTVAPASVPGEPASRVTRQNVGKVPYEIPRTMSKLFMSFEELNNLRPIGGQNGTFDVAGEQYIALQARNLGQKLANWRTALLVGMLRGGLYAHDSGPNRYWDWTSTSATWSIDPQLPSGNKTQLNMLGAGSIITSSWDNPSAPIPTHLANVNSAFQQLNGGALRTILCTHVMWNFVVNNDAVIAGGGVASTPFDVYERIGGVGPDGTPINAFRGRLRAVPWIDWIITDEGLSLGAEGSESYTKMIPDTGAIFLDTISPTTFQMLEGSEVVVEREGAPQTLRTGTFAYAVPVADPAGIYLYTGDNALPVGYVPNSWAFPTLRF